MLPDEGLEALIDVFEYLEHFLLVPDLAELIFMVFLPKPTGGKIPIGLFTTVLRLWTRTRRPL